LELLGSYEGEKKVEKLLFKVRSTVFKIDELEKGDFKWTLS
jgi:hypothetical protein